MIRSPLVRRRLALLVMAVAGLASLATQEPPRPAQVLHHVIEVGELGGSLTGWLQVYGPSDADDAWDLTVRPRNSSSWTDVVTARFGEGFDASGTSDHILVRGWRARFDMSQCQPNEPCRIAFKVELELVQPWRGPGLLPLTVELYATGYNYGGGPFAEVALSAEPPGVGVPATLAAFVGALAGAIILAAGASVNDRKRSLVLGGWSVALVGAMVILLTQGSLMQGISAVPALLWAVMAAPLAIVASLADAGRQLPGARLAASLIGLSGTVALLVTDVLSRPIDFVVAFALCAALGIVGLGTLAWNPQRESLPPLSRLGFVALGGAVVVAPLVGLWAVLTVSRLSDFDGSFALVPVATVPLSLWALWRQASGRRSASTLFASLLMLLTPPAVLAVIVLLRGSEETALPAAELAMLGAISACAVALYIAAGTPAVRRRS